MRMIEVSRKTFQNATLASNSYDCGCFDVLDPVKPFEGVPSKSSYWNEITTVVSNVSNLKAWPNKAQSAGYEGGLRSHNYLIPGDDLWHYSNVATDSVVNWRGQGTV